MSDTIRTSLAEFGPDSISSRTPAKLVVHAYTIPNSLKPFAKDVVALGFREITLSDDQIAVKRSSGSNVRLASEYAKESLCAIGKDAGKNDGSITWTRVSTGDGTADSVWAQLHAKIRTLCITAYSDLHVPSDEETGVFRESAKVITL